MKKRINMVCCFSGRFDRPHIGHIVQAMRLGQKYKEVVIPILDYPGQHYSIQYRRQVMLETLRHAKGNYRILSHTEHFAEISAERARAIGFDIYVSGNAACLKNIESLGYPIEYIDRAFDYSATEEFITGN